VAEAHQNDLLERLIRDPDSSVRRQLAIALGRSAQAGQPGLRILERLSADNEMPVRAAAYVARLLQGIPVPLPPGIEPTTAAEAVRDGSDLPTLRETARGAPGEDRRLAAALALALLHDEVAREVARTDPIPSIRHRVSGALELALLGSSERAQ
jgi:HEAT repeat protein